MVRPLSSVVCDGFEAMYVRIDGFRIDGPRDFVLRVDKTIIPAFVRLLLRIDDALHRYLHEWIRRCKWFETGWIRTKGWIRTGGTTLCCDGFEAVAHNGFVLAATNRFDSISSPVEAGQVYREANRHISPIYTGVLFTSHFLPFPIVSAVSSNQSFRLGTSTPSFESITSSQAFVYNRIQSGKYGTDSSVERKNLEFLAVTTSYLLKILKDRQIWNGSNR